MTAKWFELVTGPLEEKKQYRQAKARLKNLPAPYRAAAEAVERYLMVAGGIARGDVVVRMYVDLVDLFEQSAADGTPIRDVVGEDPVDFVDTFVANYGDGSWMNKCRFSRDLSLSHFI
ncbi:MAG: DUF1048 domain-containing protein [Micropruina sp.]|nr:DUF1048 domain-containing protein [Micropruina sp.]